MMVIRTTDGELLPHSFGNASVMKKYLDENFKNSIKGVRTFNSELLHQGEHSRLLTWNVCNLRDEINLNKKQNEQLLCTIVLAKVELEVLKVIPV